MQPRWLVTLDTDLKPLPVSVRVGTAVDVVAKAGQPKTIAGIHTHTTPVLLQVNCSTNLLFKIVLFYLNHICEKYIKLESAFWKFKFTLSVFFFL